MKSANVLCVVAVLLMASLGSAATIRYKGSGSWDDIDPSDGAGWEGGVMPGSADTVRFNWGDNTVTLDYAAPTISKFQMGVDESGGLVVNSGGVLTALGTSKVGNNGAVTGRLTINAGGVVNANGGWVMVGGNVGTTGVLNIDGGAMNIVGHLWVASNTDSIGTVDITGGTLSIGGMIGIGTIDAVNPSGGTGTVNVNDGGLLALANIHDAGTSIHPGSMLNLYGTGQVTLPGNFEGVIANYAAAGLISGDGIPGNIKTDLTTNPDFTTITVIPEPATMILLGLGGLALLRVRGKKR